jgi:hypothetical protein
MESITWARVGIVASVVGAVGALAYLLRGGKESTGAGPVGVSGQYWPSVAGIGTGAPALPGTVVQAGVAGPAGAPGAAGAPGVPGQAVTGPAGATGIPGATGPTGETGAIGPAGVTPSLPAIQSGWLSTLQIPASGTIVSNPLTTNLPPTLDPAKFWGVAGVGKPANGGCGCGGSNGCGGGCDGAKRGQCPNAAGPLGFPDGRGACISTSPGKLQQAMDQCKPGNLESSLRDVMQQFVYFGGTPSDSDWSTFAQGFGNMLSNQPTPLNLGQTLHVPPSRFGAS